ncbi:DUF1093 domain-containing protein [Lacticaseibacillus camelliae]|uniref:DUF1093 domain-containing protein n=2 Tax=Lacticaseibacillus camelliae TaxID=381742 RepID=UPI0009E78C18|nr:DUF1093 domain-containing protein [Lacticaseibacillus camelliae]
MKRACCNVGALMIIMAVILFGAPLFTRDQPTEAAGMLDRYNPVLPQETVYVATGGCSVEWVANAHGGRDYRYRLPSYSRDGRERKLLLQVTDKPLAPHAYLAVRSKGQTVLSWRRVKASQIPVAARHRLVSGAQKNPDRQ